MSDYTLRRGSHESEEYARSEEAQADDKLIPDEATLHHARAPRTHKTRSHLVWVWRVTVTVLALGWVIPVSRHTHDLRVAFGGESTSASTSTPSTTWPRPHLSPLPSEVFQTVKKTFFPDERYIGSSNDTHHNWDHLVAAHDALYIADPEKYGLPEGIPPPFDHPGKVGDGPHKFYVISGLHQMHCLNIIRFHYFQVDTGVPRYVHYSKEAWGAHMEHCFEYLRLSISCGSPFTVEGSSPLADPGGHGLIASTVTGWGVEHECINYEAMRTFQINQEKLYNQTWRA